MFTSSLKTITQTSSYDSDEKCLDNGTARLKFRTHPSGPEFGSGIEGQEFFQTLEKSPESGISPQTNTNCPKSESLIPVNFGVRMMVLRENSWFWKFS